MKSVAVIGGGLAGLAAAAALADSNLRVELFESRRALGGRAGSFTDPATGELIDHCQHVSLGCCTNLADFCRRTLIADLMRTDNVLHFFGPEGRQYDVTTTRWLPAPAHLAPSLMRLGYLTWSERLGIARAMWRLIREPAEDRADGPTVGDWLRRQGQSQRAIDGFWGLVLVSALGESVERASLAYVRKVFVDGFLTNRRGYEVLVPRVPLGEIYGRRLLRWLQDRNIAVHLATPVQRIEGEPSRVADVRLATGELRAFDFVIAAIPWNHCRRLFPDDLAQALPELAGVEQIESAPITAVHLWFDRPITSLPHAVLVGRVSQWLFNRGQSSKESSAAAPRYYYQIVISASRDVAAQEREKIAMLVRDELADLWPEARAAKLLDWRVLTQPSAVFSVSPGIDAIRPRQRTAIPNLMLAGDWTATHWPATMEGAVRSGYLAAEAVLDAVGQPRSLMAPDLSRARMTRLLPG